MKIHSCSAAVLFLLLLSPCMALCAPTMYAIHDLGRGVLPSAINNGGDVAGTVGFTETVPEAFVYKGGVMTRLGTFGGVGSWGVAINDHADLLAKRCNSTECNSNRGWGGDPMLVVDGRVTDLRLTSARLSNANRINNAGQILGTVDAATLPAGARRVVLYNYVADTVTVVADISDPWSPVLGALNNLGQAVYLESVCGSVECTVPYLYSGGASRELSGPWMVTDINDRGQITGEVEGSGIIYINGPVLIADRLFVPHALNNQTFMVGRARTEVGAGFYAATYDGQITPVTNSVLSSEDDWVVEYLLDVNDHGQIIGYGRKNGEANHGFVMTPISGNQYPVTLTIEGTGNGSVNGAMSCISRAPCPPVSFAQDTQAYLIATPDANSVFGGWRGGCTTTGNTCLLTMNGPKSVTATFTASPSVRILGDGEFLRLSDAFAAAPNNAVIQARSILFHENITLLRPVRLTLNGGYNAGFTLQSGRSEVNGRLLIRNGTLRVNRVALR